MTESHSSNAETSGLRYPDLRIGFVFAALSLSWWLIKSQINSPLAGVIISLCVAGLIYLYWCIFRIHKIMKQITGGKISNTPSQVVVYLLIPFFNTCWAFVWINRVFRSLNEIQGSKKIKSFFSSLVLSASLFIWVLILLFPLSLLGSFLVLSFIIKKIKETVAIDASGAKIIAVNTSQADSRQVTKKHLFWSLIKISGVVLLLVFISLPRLLLLPVQREGIKLVPLIENYKITHGIYPESLNQLDDEVKYIERMIYKTNDGRTEFVLGCRGGWTTKAVYKSVSGKWEMIN